MSTSDFFNKDINNAGDCLDWTATIENDGQENIILKEGDYVYQITEFERGRFPGSEKIPPCNKAIITAEVDTPEGKARVKFDLILYRTLEFRLSGFFRSISRKKHGERLVMDWSNLEGAKGMAHIKPRHYTNKYGEEKTVNDLAYFIDYREGDEALY